MKEKNKKKKANGATIKGVIFEIVFCVVALVGLFAFTLYICEAYKNWLAKFQECFTYVLFFTGLALIGLFDGIIKLYLLIKKKKKQNTQNEQTQNTEQTQEKDDKK